MSIVDLKGLERGGNAFLGGHLLMVVGIFCFDDSKAKVDELFLVHDYNIINIE